MLGSPNAEKSGATENQHHGDAGRLRRNRWFESGSLQRGVWCEHDFRERIPSMTGKDFANAKPGAALGRGSVRAGSRTTPSTLPKFSMQYALVTWSPASASRPSCARLRHRCRQLTQLETGLTLSTLMSPQQDSELFYNFRSLA